MELHGTEGQGEPLEDRLARLGLPSWTVISEALLRGHLARAMCTPSHPPTYLGQAQWGETNAGLREFMARDHGWRNCNAFNIPKTVSPDGSLAVTATSGDEFTGDPAHAVAGTMRPRRTAGIHLVQSNLQLSLDLDLPATANEPEVPAEAADRLTWYLLYRRGKETLLSEICLPTAVDANGNFEACLERIILPKLDLGGPAPLTDDGRTPDVDIPLERRTV